MTDATLPQHLTSAQVESLSIQELTRLLSDSSHYENTETRNYGERDPLNSPESLVWRCREDCTARLTFETPSPQQLRMARGLAIRPDVAVQSVRCSTCGLEGSPSLREWRAVVDWNYLRARAGEGSLEDFPFFNLKGLSLDEIVFRLDAIRYDLLLRRALERKRKAAGEDVGGRFLAKIDAYLGWANIGLALVPHARRSRASLPATPMHKADDRPSAGAHRR